MSPPVPCVLNSTGGHHYLSCFECGALKEALDTRGEALAYETGWLPSLGRIGCVCVCGGVHYHIAGKYMKPRAHRWLSGGRRHVEGRGQTRGEQHSETPLGRPGPILPSVPLQASASSSPFPTSALHSPTPWSAPAPPTQGPPLYSWGDSL